MVEDDGAVAQALEGAAGGDGVEAAFGAWFGDAFADGVVGLGGVHQPVGDLLAIGIGEMGEGGLGTEFVGGGDHRFWWLVVWLVCFLALKSVKRR